MRGGLNGPRFVFSECRLRFPFVRNPGVGSFVRSLVFRDTLFWQLQHRYSYIRNDKRNLIAECRKRARTPLQFISKGILELRRHYCIILAKRGDARRNTFRLTPVSKVVEFTHFIAVAVFYIYLDVCRRSRRGDESTNKLEIVNAREALIRAKPPRRA